MIGFILSFIDEADSVGVDPLVGGGRHLDGLEGLGRHHLHQ